MHPHVRAVAGLRIPETSGRHRTAITCLDHDQCGTCVPQSSEDAVQLGLVDGAGAQGGRAVVMVHEVDAARPRRPVAVEVAADPDLVHLTLRAHHAPSARFGDGSPTRRQRG